MEAHALWGEEIASLALPLLLDLRPRGEAVRGEAVAGLRAHAADPANSAVSGCRSADSARHPYKSPIAPGRARTKAPPKCCQTEPLNPVR
jgi:hypothetical protein